MNTKPTELNIFKMGDRFFFDVRIPGGEWYEGQDQRYNAQIRIYDSILADLCSGIKNTVDAINMGGKNDTTGIDEFKGWGTALYNELMGDRRFLGIIEKLNESKNPLQISAPAEPTFPWELLHDGDNFLGIKYALGRFLLSPEPNMVAKITPRKTEAPSRCLLIVNPTGEQALRDIEIQAEQLRNWLQQKEIECTPLIREQADRKSVLRELSSGGYDIIHYCGHVKSVRFQGEPVGDEEREEYAFILSEGLPLPASSIQRAAKGVTLAFINGCASSVGVESLTRAFIVNGARLVVGTLYDIPPYGGRFFAEKFYEKILDGEIAGEAFRYAREATQQEDMCLATWAAFVMYGNPYFQLVEKLSDKLMPDAEERDGYPSSTTLSDEPVKRQSEKDMPEWLDMDLFDGSCWQIIEDCLEYARPTGMVSTAHLFAAMMGRGMQELREGIEKQDVSSDMLKKVFQQSLNLDEQDDADTGELGEALKYSRNVREILSLAQDMVRSEAADEHEVKVDEHILLKAFVEQGGGSVGDILEEYLGLDLQEILGEQLKEIDALGLICKADCEPSAWYVINRSAKITCRSGSVIVGTPHLFLALLSGKNDCAPNDLREHRISPTLLKLVFQTALGHSARGRRNPSHKNLRPSQNVAQILETAKRHSSMEGREQIQESDLWKAFVQNGGGSISRFLREECNVELGVLYSEVFLSDGCVDEDRFDDSARYALKSALHFADDVCQNVIATPYLFMGFCSIEGGLTQTLLLRQGCEPQDVIRSIERAFVPTEIRDTRHLRLVESDLSPRVKRILVDAERLSKSHHAPGILSEESSKARSQIQEKQLLLAFLMDGGQTTQLLYKLGVNLPRMKRDIEEGTLMEAPSSVSIHVEDESGRILGRDLTQWAREGKLRPVIGRSKEMSRILTIMMRETKNAPLLVGDAGVGKTAIVEGFAQLIADGKVPGLLERASIVEIPVSQLVSGTMYRGDFERRMEKVIREVERRNIILFIDEVHTLLGAGAAGRGSLDASNILKPFIARGDIKCIGATTLDEYRKSIERDTALARRFQAVFVEEPDTGQTIQMLKGLREHYEQHFGLRISDEAIEASVRLSARYLPERRYPDKACDVIEEACANVKVEMLTESDLEKLPHTLTAEDISDVISEMVPGIRVGHLRGDEQELLLHLEEKLSEHVFGQEEAISTVAQAIRSARMNLQGMNRPIGVFLFAGPTGVGKTFLAQLLAEQLFGSQEAMIRLDMSEYSQQYTVSRLIGAPPGFIGHEEEGQLTGPLRRRPHSIVLIDEFERAHPEVLNVFLQLFEGRITDARGHTVDGRNAIFIMTCNMGTELIDGGGRIGFQASTARDAGMLHRDLVDQVRKTYGAEFTNRIDRIILFDFLGKGSLVKIADSQLRTIAERVKTEYGIELKFEESAVKCLVENSFDRQYGARSLLREIDKAIREPLSRKLNGGIADEVIDIDEAWIQRHRE